MILGRGLALGGSALGGVTSTVTGIFVDTNNYLDELTNNPEEVYKYRDQASYLNQVAMGQKVVEAPPTTRSNSPKLDERLNKYYFGPWRVISEGWGDDLYLIDGDDKFHKIQASGHSNDVKSLWSGRKLIDGEHYWFGPRLFPFDVEETSKGNNLSTWKATINLLKRQSRAELQRLSRFLQGKNDEEMCEIIDVLTHCGNLKRKLVDGDKPINSGLTFKLEQIVDSLKDVEMKGQTPSEQEWKAFADILANALKIDKLSVFQRPVAKEGAEWMKTVSINRISSAEGNEKIDNPFQYLEKIIMNERFGLSCQKKEELFTKYFDECQSKTWGEVTHVLKTASDCCFEDGKTYGVSKKGGGDGWWTQHLVEPEEKETYIKFTAKIETALVNKGIVEEKCKNLYMKIWFVKIKSPGSEFCHEINKLVFGNTVNEKRYCRYEIDNARGYLRTYRFNVFSFPRWVKGKAFWAKCHANGD